MNASAIAVTCFTDLQEDEKKKKKKEMEKRKRWWGKVCYLY
jgi:hypothetical protein